MCAKAGSSYKQLRNSGIFDQRSNTGFLAHMALAFVYTTFQLFYAILEIFEQLTFLFPFLWGENQLKPG